MNRYSFINTNNNKTANGFLLADIVVGLALFFITMYCFLAVGANSFFLLQRLIKKSVDMHKQFLVASAVACRLIWKGDDLVRLCNVVVDDYVIDVRPIVFRMYDNTIILVDIVVVKRDIDGAHLYCYMMKHE